MHKFLLFSVLLAGLFVAAKVTMDGSSTDTFLDSTALSTTPPTDIAKPEILSSDQAPTITTKAKNAWVNDIASQIEALIVAGQYDAAVALINEVYAQASTENLESFKQLVFKHAFALRHDNELVSSIALLEAYAKSFDDADAWAHLGKVSAAAKDWDTTVNAYLKSSAQEHQPLAYEESLRALVRASSYLRAKLEKQNDQLGILSLYQLLYDHHPNYPRFQLELAQSYLRLSEPAKAIPLLELLQYDPELGSIAVEKLAKINSSSIARGDNNQTKDESNEDAVVAIPLKRLGNSFILTLELNSSGHEMLLDTGASITALSKELIQNLGLRATGQTVRLNTANGKRTARLYKVDKVKLGPFQINNLVIAEIEFGENRAIQGLVGTDLLNLLSTQYGYVIDDRQNSLIFEPR